MKKIAFVKRNPQIRILKQAMGLKQTGRYHLALVVERYDPNLFNGVFDEIICYDKIPQWWRRVRGMGRLSSKLKPWWLKHIIKRLDVDLIHAHAEPNTVPEIAIKNAKCPVIYDAYDFAGIRQGVEALNSSEREAERFCLEHANGIVNKFPDEVIDYYRSLGYNIKSPVLHYEDYCVEEMMEPINIGRPVPDEWHIVYVGNVAPASLPKDKYGFIQFHDMARILSEQKIHFHIYPNPYQYNGKVLGCYQELEKEVPYFHFHEPVAYRRLAQEISKYHWGCNLLFRETPHPVFKERRPGFGNKYSTYLEAALPMVVNPELSYLSKLTQEYGTGLVIGMSDIERLCDIFGKVDYDQMLRKIEIRRHHFSIGTHIPRLICLYESLIS